MVQTSRGVFPISEGPLSNVPLYNYLLLHKPFKSNVFSTNIGLVCSACTCPDGYYYSYITEECIREYFHV